MHTCNGHTAEIERRALEIAAALDLKIGEFKAEIVSGAVPAWHILKDGAQPRGQGGAIPRSPRGRGVPTQVRQRLSDAAAP